MKSKILMDVSLGACLIGSIVLGGSAPAGPTLDAIKQRGVGVTLSK